MRVLVGCEFSGVVREAFRNHGHDAWSNDILPAADGSEYHIQSDVREILSDEWDLAIFHPPCTALAVSGAWAYVGRDDIKDAALGFVRELLEAPLPRIALENPVGIISTRIRKPDQYIQPYQFGHDASKKTGLWLKNLPKLKPTAYVEPRIVDGKKRWANQTDSGQNRLGPSEDRWALRSKTYEGIAEAMAQQWGSLPV